MSKVSVKESLRAGWKGFTSRPWIFIQAFLVIFLVNFAVSALANVLDEKNTSVGDFALTIASILAAILSIVVSLVASMGETNFFLRAHADTSSVSLKHLWHPRPFWKFAITTLLAGIAAFVGLLLFIVPGIILGILFIFSGFLVIEEKLAPIAALKKSIALTKGNRWSLFWLSLALLGINILGFLALLIGLVVTVPVTYLALTHAYRTVSGAPEDISPKELE